jgi:hypothetical protein
MTTTDNDFAEQTVEVEFTRKTTEERAAWRASPQGRAWLTLFHIDCVYDATDNWAVDPEKVARVERTLERCRRAYARVRAIIQAQGITPEGAFYGCPE